MSEEVEPVGEIFKDFGGWIVALAVALSTWLYNNRKVEVDESTLVLNKWKEFAEIHQADMKRLKDDMQADRARYEGELSSVRTRLKEVEQEFIVFRKEAEEQIKSRDAEIAGLKRTISQISQSTAVQLGRVIDKAYVTDETADRRDGINTKAHTAMQEVISKLDGGIGDNSIGRPQDEEDGA